MSEMSDHDMIVQILTCLKGFDGNGGLVANVNEHDKLLKGDPTATDNMLKLGVISMMQTQVTERRTIINGLKALSAVVAAIAAWVIEKLLTHT
jgi:hypothetical protein